MLTYAIGRYTAAAIREKAREQSLMLSQLLLGEPVEVVEAGKTYSRIRCSDDAFEGYVRNDQLQATDERTFRHQRDKPAFALDLYSTVLGDRLALPITFGARLPEFDGLRLYLREQQYSYSGQAALAEDLRTEAELLIRFARRWLFVPQLSGGRTPTGVDAAGLVQLVTRLINLKLPRTAEAMSHHGKMIDFAVQAQPADLAFFDNRKGQINHVGILLPDSRIIHVHDRVRIDAVDHYGIFNADLGKYTHRMRIIKRLLPDMDLPGIMVKKRNKEEVDESQMAIF